MFCYLFVFWPVVCVVFKLLSSMLYAFCISCNSSYFHCAQLFVKNVPLNRSMEELKSMFSQFGKVHGVVPAASRKNVVYMVRKNGLR